MIAMVLREAGGFLASDCRPTPEPGPGEVRIRVEACAVCRTDLHLIDGELPQATYPVVPGHEVVGIVEALGPYVTEPRLGNRVGVPWLGHTCGHCSYCENGLENLCDAPGFTGCTRDGGFATHILRYPANEKTGDEELAARVVKVLAWNVQVPDEAIKVKVEDGCVSLDGCVSWYYQRAAAQSAVAKLAGVREVLNLLAVKPPVRSTDVKAKVLAALKRTARDPDGITVRVEGDTVILDGCVDLWRERELAERAAWSTPGVHAVEDRLTLAW